MLQLWIIYWPIYYWEEVVIVYRVNRLCLPVFVASLDIIEVEEVGLFVMEESHYIAIERVIIGNMFECKFGHSFEHYYFSVLFLFALESIEFKEFIDYISRKFIRWDDWQGFATVLEQLIDCKEKVGLIAEYPPQQIIWLLRVFILKREYQDLFEKWESFLLQPFAFFPHQFFPFFRVVEILGNFLCSHNSFIKCKEKTQKYSHVFCSEEDLLIFVTAFFHGNKITCVYLFIHITHLH